MASIETHVHVLFVSHALYYHSRPCDTQPQSYSRHTVPIVHMHLNAIAVLDVAIDKMQFYGHNEYEYIVSACRIALAFSSMRFFFSSLLLFSLFFLSASLWIHSTSFLQCAMIGTVVGSISGFSISRVRVRLVRLLNKFYCYYGENCLVKNFWWIVGKHTSHHTSVIFLL